MRILVVIVIYKQSISQSDSYNSLLKNQEEFYDKLFIYDNSKIPLHAPSDFNNNKIYYYHDPSNPGLSKSYNQAAKYAKINNFDWLLLLDQDTLFPNNTWHNYINGIRSYPDINLFVPRLQDNSGRYLSPNIFFHKISKLSKTAPLGVTNLKRYIPFNSGMMVNVEAFWSVGGYNERVKLDFSDIEFIEKFKTCYRFFFVINSNCIQNFSDNIENTETLKRRFILFCQGAKNSTKKSIMDHIDYFFAVLKRTISLTLRKKTFSFIRIFFNNYFN